MIQQEQLVGERWEEHWVGSIAWSEGKGFSRPRRGEVLGEWVPLSGPVQGPTFMCRVKPQ